MPRALPCHPKPPDVLGATPAGRVLSSARAPPVVFGRKQRDRGARFTEHGHSTSPTLASTLQLETRTWPKGLGREGIPLTNLCQPVPTPTTAFSWPQLQIKIPLQSTHAVHTRGGAGACGQPWQHGSCPPANIFCQTRVFKRLLYLPSPGLCTFHALSRGNSCLGLRTRLSLPQFPDQKPDGFNKSPKVSKPASGLESEAKPT